MLENIIQGAMVAGRFYEANPERLRKDLKAMAQNTRKESALPVQAVIVPHAGYVFSGQTAMKTLAQAAGGSYKRIVLIAPSHNVAFRSIALPAYSAFRTPLGDVTVDAPAAERLQKLNIPLFRVNGQAHYQEHAIEVELPMLQYYFPTTPVLPLITGQLNFDQIREAGHYLSEFATADTLFVISSDFTHFGRNFGYQPFSTHIKENLAKLDGEAIRLIVKGDLKGFEHFLEANSATICGATGIELLLGALEGKAWSAKLVEYLTSGDLTQDWSHCVSYAGIVFYC